MIEVGLQARVLSALQHNTCWLCGLAIHPEAKRGGRATVDHVVPISKGGSGSIWNLAAAHYRCNNTRSDGPPPEEAWVRLDALHLVLQDVGIWTHEDEPRFALQNQRVYRLFHKAPLPEIKATRAARAVLREV